MTRQCRTRVSLFAARVECDDLLRTNNRRVIAIARPITQSNIKGGENGSARSHDNFEFFKSQSQNMTGFVPHSER